VTRNPSEVAADVAFGDAISRVYEARLVPLLFEPYARDISRRVAKLNPNRVLEIAAGTGAVTRALADALPRDASIIATDLNDTMLAQAARAGTSRPVEWRQADAMNLPFANGSFDAVVCQFGVMFFPEKPVAFADVRRVLVDGGAFVFNVWDRVEANELTSTVREALAARFPEAAPRFMTRVPHAYFDTDAIARDLALAGFAHAPEIVAVELTSRAPSALDAAIALCQGTPMRNEIEARDPSGLEATTRAVAEVVERRYGGGEIETRMRAFLVTVVK
jgi:SAM-dependent methyltransferase